MEAYVNKTQIDGEITTVLLGVDENDFVSAAKEIEKKGEK